MKIYKHLFLLTLSSLTVAGLLFAATDNKKENNIGRGTGRVVSGAARKYGVQEPELTSTEKLRVQQEGELKELRNTYDQRARSEIPRKANGSIDYDSPEYKAFETEYKNKYENIRKDYTAKRKDVVNKGGPVEGVRDTGTGVKDARSDADWEAATPEAADAKKKQWESRGVTLSKTKATRSKISRRTKSCGSRKLMETRQGKLPTPMRTARVARISRATNMAKLLTMIKNSWTPKDAGT